MPLRRPLKLKFERTIPEDEMSEAIDGISIPRYYSWWGGFDHDEAHRTLHVMHEEANAAGVGTTHLVMTVLTYDTLMSAINLAVKDGHLCCQEAMTTDHLGLGCTADWDQILQFGVYGELVFG